METENFFDKNLSWILLAVLFIILFVALILLLKKYTSIW
jgi:hypothetical protein